jgi:hypothetical protein
LGARRCARNFGGLEGWEIPQTDEGLSHPTYGPRLPYTISRHQQLPYFPTLTDQYDTGREAKGQAREKRKVRKKKGCHCDVIEA